MLIKAIRTIFYLKFIILQKLKKKIFFNAYNANINLYFLMFFQTYV